MADNRKRLTQRGYSPKTGFNKSADPYVMNQERRPGSNPSIDAYESGDPSSWAEDVNPVDIWKKEYEAGRDESNVGNFLPGSFTASNKDKKAAFEQARKTASKALHLANALFPDASETFIENQARDFMAMGLPALSSTIQRIIDAADSEEESDEDVDPKEEEKESKKSSIIASYETELKDIKKASDANLYRKEIKELETRLAALKASAESEDESDSKDEEKEESKVEEKESKKSSKTKCKAKDEEVEESVEDSEEVKAKSASDSEDEEEEESEEDPKESKKSSYEIDLVSSELDTLPGDTDMLDTLFASEKTASEKKRGVSKLGGVGGKSNSSVLSDLSSLWKSDPDISNDFR